MAEALAITDSALRRGAVTRAALINELEQTRGRGVVQARRVLTRADPRAATVFESALRSVTLDLGLTCLVPQLPVYTPWLRARVDLGDRVRRIAVEAESFEFHGRRAQLTRDCARTNALGLAGWLVLRFSWEQVLFEPQYVAEVVLEAHGSRVCKASKR
jgi:very-short-patch-repair endonuclease